MLLFPLFFFYNYQFLLKSFPYMNMCTSHFTHWCLYARAFSSICFEVNIALLVGKRILLWYRMSYIFFGFQEKRVVRFLLDFGRCFVIICPFSILAYLSVCLRKMSDLNIFVWLFVLHIELYGYGSYYYFLLYSTLIFILCTVEEMTFLNFWVADTFNPYVAVHNSSSGCNISFTRWFWWICAINCSLLLTHGDSHSLFLSCMFVI